MAVKEKTKNVKKKKVEPFRLFIFNRPLDYGLLGVVLILLSIGLIMVLSASGPYALRTENNSGFYFEKQLFFAGLGIIAMLVLSRVNYKIFNSRISWLIYLAGIRNNVYSFYSWCWC